MPADRVAPPKAQGPQRRPWLSALLALAAVALFAVFGSPTSLAFQPDQRLLHSWWRLLTCHLVHWSPQHLLLNTSAFLLLGWLCERASPRRYLTCVGAASFVVPIVACTLHGGLRYYAGLSGVVMGQGALLLGLSLRQTIRRRNMAGAAAVAVLALALIAKVVCELVAGETLFAAAMHGAFVTVPEAHLAGAVVGLAAGVGGHFPARLGSDRRIHQRMRRRTAAVSELVVCCLTKCGQR